MVIYWTVLGTWGLIGERLTSEQVLGTHIWVHVFRKLPCPLVCLGKRNRHGSKSLNWTVLILGFACTACCSVAVTDGGKRGPLRWMGLQECPGILETRVERRERWASETMDLGLTSRDLPHWVWRQPSCGSRICAIMVRDGRSYYCLCAGAQLGCELEGRGQVARIAWSCGAIIVSYIGNTHVGRIAVMACVSRSTMASSDGQKLFLSMFWFLAP